MLETVIGLELGPDSIAGAPGSAEEIDHDAVDAIDPIDSTNTADNLSLGTWAGPKSKDSHTLSGLDSPSGMREN